MTSSWSIPVSFPPPLVHQLPEFAVGRTRAVVPTYRDWDQARETLEGLLQCSPRPVEVVLVDDNEEADPPSWTRRREVTLLQYAGNHGPSFARNMGAWLRTPRLIDWIYFTDTGCGRDPDFFDVLQEAIAHTSRGWVAVAGPVHGVVESHHDSPINHYMTVEGILNPPRDDNGLQAIITANALVSLPAFTHVGGLDHTYPFAAGEDLDLGVKLRSVGRIAWADHAVVRHRFEECMQDFRSRFVRYGRGTAHLEHRLALASIRPAAFIAESSAHQYLADVQAASMRVGYDAHKSVLANTAPVRTN